MNNSIDDLSRSMQEMRRMSDELRDQVEKMKQAFTWSEWEPFVVGVIPCRVNGRWYWRGDVIYRREKIRHISGTKEYMYGDNFDKLKESHE